jgi:hypothetical protein
VEAPLGTPTTLVRGALSWHIRTQNEHYHPLVRHLLLCFCSATFQKPLFPPLHAHATLKLWRTAHLEDHPKNMELSPFYGA